MKKSHKRKYFTNQDILGICAILAGFILLRKSLKNNPAKSLEHIPNEIFASPILTVVQQNLHCKSLGGNPKANNLSGKGQFNYEGIEQAYYKFGLECHGI